MTEAKRREFVLPEIPAGIDEKLDEYLRQLSETIKDMSIFFASWEGLSGYVKRANPPATDFDEGDLTIDGDWHELDLSGIVPDGAVAVSLIVSIADDAASSLIRFRKPGETTESSHLLRTQVINIANDANPTVGCNSSRKIEYHVVSLTWSAIRLVIDGW